MKDTIAEKVHKKLGLQKKSTKWVPKLLNEAQKEEGVQALQRFVAAVHRRSPADLYTVVMMNETVVSQHTPEAKTRAKCGS